MMGISLEGFKRVFHLIMIIENERRRFVKWAVMYENGRTKVSNPIF